MKIFKVLLLIVLLIMSFEKRCAAENEITVTVNGQAVLFSDASPFIDENDRVLVPIRFIAETLGASVKWNDDGLEQTVFIQRSNRNILLKIGDKKAYIDCAEKSMDTSAVIINGRTFVPLRFVGESMGTSVIWLPDKRSVEITSLEEVDFAAQYYGICYGPFRMGQNPDKGIYPAKSEIKEDLAVISKFTKRIRTYGNAETLFDIPELAKEFGLDCYVGVWLGKDQTDNKKEIKRAIAQANNNPGTIKGIIVGNEAVLRGDLTPDELSGYIREVKGATSIPVGTADIYGVFLKYPEIADNADFIMVHIHPYWEGDSVDKAKDKVLAKYYQIKAAFPDKTVIIGETGFPSDGKTLNAAVPTPQSQFEFFKDFTAAADENCIPYFYFSAYDEAWKRNVEYDDSHWGIYNSDGSLKQFFSDIFPPGFARVPHELEPVVVNAPFTVFNDAFSDDNYFQPTGYMGDFEKFEGNNPVDRNCMEFPQSGESCVKIKYTAKYSPETQGWAGVYWQYPINNWGDSPGYDIKGASRITFWARGEIGGEKVEFNVGGITGPHADSINPPVSTGEVALSSDWRMYTIDLAGKDMSNVVGGFCVAITLEQNYGGAVIYLDNIRYE